MNRELALDALAGNDSANREHFASATAAAPDHGSAENLSPGLLAFENFAVNINGVADFKFRSVSFKAVLLHQFHDFVSHLIVLFICDPLEAEPILVLTL